MKFLVDENLSPTLCAHLTSMQHTSKQHTSMQHTAHHSRDVTGPGAADVTILDAAERMEAVIVTADTDFGALLARSTRTQPSIILVRALLPFSVGDQARLLLLNLPQIHDALVAGAIVVIGPEGIRVRPLPIA